jgi:acetolactate synthase-1/3 small subunit
MVCCAVMGNFKKSCKCRIFGECLLNFVALQYSGFRAIICCLSAADWFQSNLNEFGNGREMRHVISVLLQNEVGALTRMTGLFSTRGYNIDSLNVAPTDDPTVSRVTLVISGSDAAIAQLNTQLAKLVDVVNIHDMTLGEHFERELAIVKLKLPTGGFAKVLDMAQRFGAEVLDESQVSCTIQLTGELHEIDAFVREAVTIGKVAAVARSGSVAVSKGEVTLSTYARHHRLTG